MNNNPTFWHRTPPALFPCLLGLIGLGLAWRRAAEIWPVSPWMGEVILLSSSILFAVTFIFYIAKLSLRPSVLLDDLKVAPARGAVSAGSMCIMLISAAALPYSIMTALVLWWFSIVLHLVYLVCTIYSLTKVENVRATVTPPMVLPFVGLIVAAISGPQFGYTGLSKLIVFATVPGFVFILYQSALNLKYTDIPIPVRAGFAAVLAPVSIYGIAAYGLWSIDVFYILWGCAICCALLFLMFLPWLVKGGWNPGWGAFTFPLSSFAGIMLIGASSGFGLVADIWAIGSLGFATVIVPYVVVKTYFFWASGKLAKATGAAIV